MRKLSQLKRVLGGSARTVSSVMGTVANDLRGGLRELFDAPADAPAKGTSVPVTRAVPELGNPAKPVQIFGRESCPWTGRSIALLEQNGASFEFIELGAPQNATLASALVLETKQNTNPYIFLRGRFIGGYNALDEIVRLGQLTQETLSAAERARQPSRIRIEVAPRTDNDQPPPGES